jgi:hypothetical protein
MILFLPKKDLPLYLKCYLCIRTPVTYVPSLYRRGKGEGNHKGREENMMEFFSINGRMLFVLFRGYEKGLRVNSKESLVL